MRVALGATTRQVTWLAASPGRPHHHRRPAWSGTAMAVALGRFMQSALFGLVTPSLVVLGVAVLVLAAVTMAAGYVPARRAAVQDPWLALRTE